MVKAFCSAFSAVIIRLLGKRYKHWAKAMRIFSARIRLAQRLPYPELKIVKIGAISKMMKLSSKIVNKDFSSYLNRGLIAIKADILAIFQNLFS